MSESQEEKDITDAARLLRFRDREIQKETKAFGYQKFYTPWHIDSFRYEWLKSGRVEILSKDLFGAEIVVTGDKSYKDDLNRPVIDIGDMIWLQLIPKEEFGKILNIHKIFKIKVQVVQAPEVNNLIDYCNRMHEEIKDVFWRLRQKKVGDIFSKLWVVLGGDAMPPSDILGLRIRLLRDMVEGYKVDKEKWAPELKRLELLR